VGDGYKKILPIFGSCQLGGGEKAMKHR